MNVAANDAGVDLADPPGMRSVEGLRTDRVRRVGR